MDSNETTAYSGYNLMHKNDEICTGENNKVNQHYPDLENSDEGDD